MLIENQHLSPESVRAGFITHEDPLGDGVSNAEGYRRLQMQSSELAGYATLFKEIPIYADPDTARGILTREGYKPTGQHKDTELWSNGSGIIATLRVSGKQAVVYFEFQTLWACPYILMGNRSPFNLANGDVVFVYSIFAEPGVLKMLKMIQPYVLKRWRVTPRCTEWTLPEVAPLEQLKEFKPCIPAEENYTLTEMMKLSGETYETLPSGTLITTSGGVKRFWYKPGQAALSFFAEEEAVALKWLAFYQQLATYAEAQNCRLTERNAFELQLTGKLCCSSKAKEYSSLKVQLHKGQPIILDYCFQQAIELPAGL